eukprot:12249918-Alexandrium_andersonii.AAC.1
MGCDPRLHRMQSARMRAHGTLCARDGHKPAIAPQPLQLGPTWALSAAAEKDHRKDDAESRHR